MKIAFVCPYPFDEAPSQRFRFEQYFTLLESRNIHYKQMSFLTTAGWKILYQPGKTLVKGMYVLLGFLRRFFHFFQLIGYDYVMIHREASPMGPAIFEWWVIKLLRKKVIYDFDDAIWLPNTSSSNSIVSRFKFHNKAFRIAKWSSKISAGNSYLADAVSDLNSNVVVNPTTIDTSYHVETASTDGDGVVIGWTGTHSTLKYLEDLLPLFEDLRKDYNFHMLVISNLAPTHSYPWLEFKKWNKESEIADLNKIQIGLMPLSDDNWSRGKCGFKLLQYLALGIPAVASPVGVNEKIMNESNAGFLCVEIEAWKAAIVSLFDAEERITTGQKGISYVKNNYSVTSNSSTFLSLFDLE